MNMDLETAHNITNGNAIIAYSFPAKHAIVAHSYCVFHFLWYNEHRGDGNDPKRASQAKKDDTG